MHNDPVPSPRIPIWLQLSLATMVVLAVSITVLSYVIMKRQQNNLFEHIVKLGSVSVSYIADNAKVPLLSDDMLALSTLVNNVVSVDGHHYALIVDSAGIIKAHTDHGLIGKSFQPFAKADDPVRQGAVTYFNYPMSDGTRVLNLSMPILFQEKQLGEVHVGLSVDFIRELFVDERAFLVWAMLIIIFLGMIAAVVYSRRFTRPISALVQATAQIARGNYEYRVDSSRNDELGTLGAAFNHMGSELSRQAVIRESFGKYVGSEVLELITKSPEQGWLKGQRGEASILFADIRGFTAYAEDREPEEVVEKLNEFFAIATDVIVRHGGYVDKFIGDSVLAVFGVPVTQQDHLRRCVEAAVQMQQELARAAGNGNPLLPAVGIGIASGIVVAGNIGSPAKMEYTVIGDSVNVASSLNSLAGAGEIVVGSDSGVALNDIAETQPLTPQKIKGRERLVHVFKIIRMFCCLLPVVTILFGCAALTDQRIGDAREDVVDEVAPEPPLPVSGQLQARADADVGNYHRALDYWRWAEMQVKEQLVEITAHMREIAAEHAGRGVALFEQKKGAEACRAFIEALRHDPDNGVALDYLSNRYQAARFIDYTILPGDTYAGIAEITYGSPTFSFAVQHFSNAGREDELTDGRVISLVDLDSFFSSVLQDYNKDIRIARQMFGDEAFAAVIPLVRTILANHPGDQEASYILNRSLLALAREQREQGEYEQAIETLSMVDPHFRNVKDLLLEIEAQKQQTRIREAALTNARLFQQGKEYLDQGRFLEALEAFRQVEGPYDGLPQIVAVTKQALKEKAEEYFKEGVRFFVEEDLHAAIASWEQTLRLDPDHANAAHSLEKARALLERVSTIR